jgi:hypothetical protein
MACRQNSSKRIPSRWAAALAVMWAALAAWFRSTHLFGGTTLKTGWVTAVVAFLIAGGFQDCHWCVPPYS